MSLLNRNIEQKNDLESNRVNIGEDDELTLQGYEPSFVRSLGLFILYILSCGIFVILTSWRPGMKIRIANRQCSLEHAKLLIVRDKHGNEFIEKVHSSQRDQSFCFKYFHHKKLKYVWKNEYKHFEKLKGLESQRCSVIYSQAEGATWSEAELKLDLYGQNSIEIEVLPIWKLVLDEVTGPFYLYQFFICSIWLLQLYYQFATCILLLSILSVATHVWQTRKQSIALRRQVQSTSTVSVVRDNRLVKISSIELVPGDVLVLPKHSQMNFECDAVLLTGSCIVDESMLTGESVPVPKIALVENVNSIYSPSIHKSNTLFSGTRLLNVHSRKDEDEVKAVVVRTGFSTAKGELARSILFPIQANNNLKKQLIKMSAIFFVIGLPCMGYTAYALKRFSYTTAEVLLIVIDVGTFLIPPVLPAVLTSINVHGQRRLKTKGIYCLNPRMITCSGEVDVMCFDKTGTLTEDTIDFAGIIPWKNHDNDDEHSFDSSPITDLEKLNDDLIVKSMAACHSLVQYEGNFEGDDLDIKLFTATGWRFADLQQDHINWNEFDKSPERIVTNDVSTIAIVKQFPFESFLQRMLVIGKDLTVGRYLAIIKGAPEIVASFCTNDTIPKDFLQTFESYTRRGFRVLATAVKWLPTNINGQDCVELARTEMESQMQFVGLYLFKNKLKSATYDSLKELSDADIRCVMATGDHLLTGISVAEECELIPKTDSIIKVHAHQDTKLKSLVVKYSYVKFPNYALPANDSNANFEMAENIPFNYHLAIDGDSFNAIRNDDQQLLNWIVAKGAIFARMSPDQKLNLINLLQKQGHSVGMCGDGANDCGALRAADAGISLSLAEASVASPFTYKKKDISCVPLLLKEGRCTLVATFGAFKYQVCYCFILLGAVLILFWYGTKPAEGTYVFVDIILNLLPPMLFGTTKPYHKLVRRKPIRNILSIVPQISMFSFILLQVAIYVFVTYSLVGKPWYEPMADNSTYIMDPPVNHLSYAIFSANMMSYVVSAIIFAPGPPYREQFFANKKYISVVTLNFLLIGMATMVAPQFLLDFLKFQPMPFDFRLQIFLISIGNFVFFFLWEKLFLEQILGQIIKRIKKKMNMKSSKPYKSILEEIDCQNWPFNDIIAPSSSSFHTNGNMKRRSSKSSDSLPLNLMNRFINEEML
ncbi:hypothetical protein BLOT_016274 [Blomia tropicalis]|nr:hypothetical protein BLOT_016274 [Blomia tropicalis]